VPVGSHLKKAFMFWVTEDKQFQYLERKGGFSLLSLGHVIGFFIITFIVTTLGCPFIGKDYTK
jgi:hypothetical protein